MWSDKDEACGWAQVIVKVERLWSTIDELAVAHAF